MLGVGTCSAAGRHTTTGSQRSL